MATGLAIVEGEVRELIRQRGINPIAEVETVSRLIDEVTADYLDRSVNAALPPLGDLPTLTRSLRDSVCGFGPLQPYLDDPTIEEIWINEPGRVFIARRGRSELTTTILAADQVAELVERMLRSSGRRVDLSTPFVDAMLPDGSRLHVVIPQITRRHMAVNIRKFVVARVSLDELVSLGSLPEPAARFLEASVAAGLNILVSGGTQAGPTRHNDLISQNPWHSRGLGVIRYCDFRQPTSHDHHCVDGVSGACRLAECVAVNHDLTCPFVPCYRGCKASRRGTPQQDQP